ncbi:hypothetical protein [Vibrio sp. THAF190c]|uniref:hypothetical protein n=1 Tax=Vibrio sp. THAF190c TaxID=2587865 RepID=UPI001268A7AE|nr:hypothetical protein [Vibrio sp. THAF190c]QFT13379.1 hypothetical protein FIV04_25850 [Vibrio sp. THAF190c]
MSGHPHQIPSYMPEQRTYPHGQDSNRPQMSRKERAAIQIKAITNAATQIELGETKDEIPTLTFEQTCIKVVLGKRQGDWNKKIIFQLSPDTELQQLIDFLTHRIHENELCFKYHGKDNNKSMRLTKNEDGSVMLGLSEGQKRHNGVLQPTKVSQLLILAYKAYGGRFNLSMVDTISVLNKSPISEKPKK